MIPETLLDLPQYIYIYIYIYIYYKSSEPLHLFPNLISVPVTLSPRYFGAPLYWSLIYLHP